MRRPLAVVLALVMALATAQGCASRKAQEETITVLAAASLTETFTSLAREHERAHPGTRVQLSFGGSSTLTAQIRTGAPVDVFASASGTDMEALAGEGLVDDPVVFARNRITAVVPADNPARITSVGSLPRGRVALCQPAVPCGVAGRTLLRRMGVELTPITEEPDVRAVLTKVKLGEVDAGLVYATDAIQAGDAVRELPVPEGKAVTSDYPIAVVQATDHSEAAQRFVDLVTSQRGRDVLRTAGFSTP
ncbi:molybdate ABC transporter substrate-binding protein [Luteococcus sp. Sow4_B9]|uniref:molybdate ABC transporter substrate-binding protein n=1 Tax=Luteococcus sp. Sow4_B9 TaxID=3438792 RepID=UPI003F9A3E12